MKNLIDQLRKGCALFGLKLEQNYCVNLPSGTKIVSIARLTGSGLADGMLVFTEDKSFWPFRKELSNAGFGYTVLSEPETSEIFDSESFREMIVDWGWIEAKDLN